MGDQAEWNIEIIFFQFHSPEATAPMSHLDIFLEQQWIQTRDD